MFKLQPAPTFKKAVAIPAPDGEQEVTLVFRRKTRSELQDWIDGPGSAGRKDIDAACEIVVGWEGVDAPFDRDALAALLDNYVGAAYAIFSAYLQALSGAKQKN